MKRKTPVDTKYFHYYNANPKNKNTTDCVIRAMSEATGIPYDKTLRDMAEITIKTGYMLNEKNGEQKYLESIGWVKHKQPRNFDNTKIYAKEFCEYLTSKIGKVTEVKGPIYANCGSHHVVCIKQHEGVFKVWDTWDSSNRVIGNYYTRGEWA